MTSIFETTVYRAMTAQIVHDVFDTMMRYEIEESSDDYALRSNVVTSAVYFAGAWKGALVVECSADQALLFTQLMMGIPRPARMDDDTRDAMGEVVNMIGGNLKPVLPPGVSLSMPSVLEGADYAYRICGSNRNERTAFRGAAGPLWVTLVQVAEAGS